MTSRMGRITEQQIDRMITLLERKNQLLNQDLRDLGYSDEQIQQVDNRAGDITTAQIGDITTFFGRPSQCVEILPNGHSDWMRLNADHQPLD